jgi:hypothetical protein
MSPRLRQRGLKGHGLTYLDRRTRRVEFHLKVQVVRQSALPTQEGAEDQVEAPAVEQEASPLRAEALLSLLPLLSHR